MRERRKKERPRVSALFSKTSINSFDAALSHIFVEIVPKFDYGV